MIHTLVIDGYRGFDHFEMGELGRVNLLVGTNNSGKTSILEALYLLESAGDATSIWRIVARRGERSPADAGGRQPDTEYDLSHLFHNHDLKVGGSFSFHTKNQSPPRSIKFTIEQGKQDKNKRPEVSVAAPQIYMQVTGSQSNLPSDIPLTRRGGLRAEAIEGPRRGQKNLAATELSPVQYVSTESLSVDELALMWNQIALTESEQRVVKALKFLEPKVERIAPNFSAPYYYSPMARGGFIVKLAGLPQPIPIGSLGDGTWRMLALAIALSRAENGVLLVDEIDTGLHYSVMADMWRLIYETARALNVQVFATTHSYDCVDSLSTICVDDSDNEVTLQRIDPSKEKATPFTASEIRMAAERRIEVR